jgi:hypothetical protein
MAGYVKVWSSIIHSTIWQHPGHVKLTWITMLVMADKRGEIAASIPGLASAVGITIEEVEDALEILKAPDKYSRTPDNEGRRIETIPGGWIILNYVFYRQMMSEDDKRERTAERTRRWRSKQETPVTLVTQCDTMSHAVTQSDATQYPVPSTQLTTPLPLSEREGIKLESLGLEVEGDLPPAKKRSTRKRKMLTEDISPENAPFLQTVFKEATGIHPLTGQDYAKGAPAAAARAFELLVSAGVATPRELMQAGLLYYRAEEYRDRFGVNWAEESNRAWETRSKFMMQISTFYGQQKKTYASFLPLAKLFLDLKLKQTEEVK